MDPKFQEILTKLVLSMGIGLVIGAEREFRNKSAGLRTIMLICLGSTLFTIISVEMADGGERARIASNIVTGVGFLGAGAIMREGLSISGLTTASTIWVAASLGMAVGAREYKIALIATVLVLIVLTIFTQFQKFLENVRKMVELHITFDVNKNYVDDFESRMKEMKIRFTRRKESRKNDEAIYQYDLVGREKNIKKLFTFLSENKEQIKGFEY